VKRSGKGRTGVSPAVCALRAKRIGGNWLILMGLLVAHPSLQAQIIDNTNPTVVTVTAQAIPLSATSASVTILSSDYIGNSHADNAADLLRAAPFLQIAQSGASGGLTTVTIRGGKPNFTLVMIDGVPVNDIDNLLGGSFDLSSLPIDNIDHVEIVRGPLSAVFGSDAIGGVINFISKKGSKVRSVDVSGELGSFDRRQVGLSTAGAWKALQYSAGGSWLDVGKQVIGDSYSLGSLNFNGSLSLGKNMVLDFNTRWLDDESAGFPTGSGGPELALARAAVSDHATELILGASLKGQVRPWWLYTVDLDWVHRTENNSTPPVLDRIPPTYKSLPSSTSETDFARTRFGATSRFILPAGFSLALSAGVRQEDGNSKGFLAGVIPQSFDLGRTSLLASSELQYSISRLTATAGFSFDKSEGYGEVTSPRVGLVWLTAEHGPRFRTTWAKGFKLPSFYSFGNPIVGNRALRPERARSFDAGVEQTVAQTHVTVSGAYFRNDFRDLIDFDSATFRLVNRSQALIQGAEFGADYAAGAKVRFGLDMSYVTWTLQNTTQPLRNIPHANGGIHLDWKFSDRLRARAETQWMGRRYDYEVPVPNDTSVGGYSDTNISASYDMNKKFSVYMRGDNLFNSSFHEYIGFPNPGIAIRFGVRYHAIP
jgi:vitamin B12 transporter